MSEREVNMKDLSTAGWLTSDNHSSTSLAWWKKKKKQTKQERQKESLLAKRNELSGKCFSNTSLRPESMSKNGYVTRVNRCFLCCQPLPERPFAPDSNKETVFITVTLRHFTSNLELWLDLVTFEAQSHHKNGDCLIQTQFLKMRLRKSIISYHSATTNAELHNGLRMSSRPLADPRPTLMYFSCTFSKMDNIFDMAPTCSCEGEVYTRAYYSYTGYHFSWVIRLAINAVVTFPIFFVDT